LRRTFYFLAPRELRAFCCSWPACIVVFRALGHSRYRARVGAFRIFVLRVARGSSQRDVYRQRLVLCTQATSLRGIAGHSKQRYRAGWRRCFVLPSNISFKADGFAAA
jgi:hypothetical protein